MLRANHQPWLIPLAKRWSSWEAYHLAKGMKIALDYLNLPSGTNAATTLASKRMACQLSTAARHWAEECKHRALPLPSTPNLSRRTNANAHLPPRVRNHPRPAQRLHTRALQLANTRRADRPSNPGNQGARTKVEGEVYEGCQSPHGQGSYARPQQTGYGQLLPCYLDHYKHRAAAARETVSRPSACCGWPVYRSGRPPEGVGRFHQTVA